MEHSIIYYTGVAFLGGVILNVMPCVLPVLTMKVFHVIEKAKEDPSVNRKHGLAYSAGILAMFWVFAGIIITLRMVLGKNLQWGQQFQSPAFVAGMTALMIAAQEKADAVARKADQRDQHEHGRGQRESDNQMAGDGKAIRQHAEHIAEQNEHKQREDEREIAHALSPDIFLNHIGDEFISYLAH